MEPGLNGGAKKTTGSPWMGLLIILATSLTAFTLSLVGFFEGLELKLYDRNFQIRGPKPVDHSEIVIVAIDQETADSLSFPFDRSNYAKLVRMLNRLGAKLIAFDIDFSSRGYNPESDSLFKAAVERADNVVHQGKVSYVRKRGFKEQIASVKPPVLEVAPPDNPWGLINELVDQDGVTRRYALFLPADDSIYVSLGLKIYSLLKGFEEKGNPFVQNEPFRYGDLSVPRYELSSALINYYGPAATFPTYSFVAVLRGDYDFGEMLEGLSDEELELLKASGMMDDLFGESPFQDKVVLVGASDENLQDNKFTPFFTPKAPYLTPGVEVHCNALQMFLDGTFIHTVGLNWRLLGVVLLSVIIFLSGRYLAQGLGIGLAVVMLVLVLVGGFQLFVREGLWLQQMPLLLAVVIAYPANLVYRFILAQKEKAVIRGMFGKYVPKKVADALIANPELAKLGGEKRRMSVLFTDVAGFTTVSEKLTPEELVHLLNEYLTAMTRVVLDHEGIIDKYEGDLIMAEFGAPLWTPDHATNACRAALRMQQKLAQMREVWKQAGRIELYSRVGINTGDMIIGNMGSEEVFDYTVMGDSVNLASRLEGANKGYGTTIMIGKGTWDDVKDKFVTRPLDLLRVKGKTEPVEVFELLSESPDELPKEKLEALRLYNEGIVKYRTRYFEEAGELFAQAMMVCPDDEPSSVYHDRAAQYFIETPPPDWDGAWTLMEK